MYSATRLRNGAGHRLWTLRACGWLTGMTGGAIAFPLAAMLHELGHFVAFRVFGFDVVLRFSSVRWTGLGEFQELMRAGDVESAMEIAQPWQVAVGAAAGPIVTYLTVIACVLAIRRFGPLSLVLGVGLVSPIRFLVAIPFFALKLQGKPAAPRADEALVAVNTGIPVSLLFLLGLTCLVLGYWFLVTAIPHGRRVRVLVPTFGGLVLGGFLWALWLGPLLLP